MNFKKERDENKNEICESLRSDNVLLHPPVSPAFSTHKPTPFHPAFHQTSRWVRNGKWWGKGKGGGKKRGTLSDL